MLIDPISPFILSSIASKLTLPSRQIETTVNLLNQGNTIPFIARYRKEATGFLDEQQLRNIGDEYEYFLELEERKVTVLNSIELQEKLTPVLRQRITALTSKQILEDLYLPYKPKRRTLASIAREKGLEPLAILIETQKKIEEWIVQFLASNKDISEKEECINGALDIIAEKIAENFDLKEKLRTLALNDAQMTATVRKDFANVSTKYNDYYQFSEKVKVTPTHRILAIRRGEQEKILRTGIHLNQENIETEIIKYFDFLGKPNEELMQKAVSKSYRRLISPALEVEIRSNLKEKADGESIAIFGENLKNMLLAPYAGEKTVVALDPGFRTGVKWVLLDTLGQWQEYGVIYPIPPANKKKEAEQVLNDLYEKYSYDYICIGNGTASHETEVFIAEFLKKYKILAQSISVNESGASVYSASEEAREELPELDVTIRGAISIGRRFQDPLAELVKIDPKSIGIGQYQHDVNQIKLKKQLNEVTEHCVNIFGVNVNTASIPLLSHVSGLTKTLAKTIINYRNQNGAIQSREELKKIPRFGEKTFEQAAGFLRIPKGNNPADNTAIHPMQYGLITAMANKLEKNISEIVGVPQYLNQLKPAEFVNKDFGLVTVKEVLEQLKYPGRDPREKFRNIERPKGIEKIEDLYEGLWLEGKITNLTQFGAFVDLGVHQEGLLHISEMANHFIKKPSEVCQTGQIIKVGILKVEPERKRINLTLKKSSLPEEREHR